MIISHTRRVVILSPWKTASQTIQARLDHYSESPYDPMYEFNPVLRRVVHQHMTYADFAELPEARLGYRTAAFVRNPYDRVYSGFLQCQRDIVEQPRLTFTDASVRSLVMGWLADNLAQLTLAGYDFNRWLGLIADHQIHDAGVNPCFPLHPVHYWTHHDGERKVDWIGRVETFEPDFAELCATHGLTPRSDENGNVSSSDLRGNHFGYRHVHRMNAASIDKINRLFDRDFALLGYPMLEPRAAAGIRRDAGRRVRSRLGRSIRTGALSGA